jgi:hypothetical protein
MEGLPNSGDALYYSCRAPVARVAMLFWEATIDAGGLLVALSGRGNARRGACQSHIRSMTTYACACACACVCGHQDDLYNRMRRPHLVKTATMKSRLRKRVADKWVPLGMCASSYTCRSHPTHCPNALMLLPAAAQPFYCPLCTARSPPPPARLHMSVPKKDTDHVFVYMTPDS